MAKGKPDPGLVARLFLRGVAGKVRVADPTPPKRPKSSGGAGDAKGGKK